MLRRPRSAMVARGSVVHDGVPGRGLRQFRSAGLGRPRSMKSIVVGSGDFPESEIIAEIYAQALQANGFDVGRRMGIGSRETYIPALKDHSDRPGAGVHRQPAAVL